MSIRKGDSELTVIRRLIEQKINQNNRRLNLGTTVLDKPSHLSYSSGSSGSGSGGGDGSVIAVVAGIVPNGYAEVSRPKIKGAGGVELYDDELSGQILILGSVISDPSFWMGF